MHKNTGIIRDVRRDDAPAIADIYNYYIENTIVSFEELPITPQEMESRILKITSKFPYIIFEQGGIVEGYAYLSTWRERISYRYAAELAIYLRHGSEGRGIGSLLMDQLLRETEASSIRALIACISLPNPASVALHEKFGFVRVGLFPEVGYKMNQWIDVGFWEKIIADIPPRL
ncbi:MAG: GNAT family N-acetyltransferase [Tannerellaceae bacterium]|jgi:phosphinothricin acetyltransferase|nr:GNAT family N-acetyltransferase [Tannerellaceae bacterium]